MVINVWHRDAIPRACHHVSSVMMLFIEERSTLSPRMRMILQPLWQEWRTLKADIAAVTKEMEERPKPPRLGRGFAAEAIRAVLALARTLGHKRVVSSRLSEIPRLAMFSKGSAFAPKAEQPWRFADVQKGKVLSEIYVFDLAETFGMATTVTAIAMPVCARRRFALIKMQ